MDNPEWRETTVELPTRGSWGDMTTRTVRFSGSKIQVLDSHDMSLPNSVKLSDWLREIDGLSHGMADTTVDYAEPFFGGSASDISLVLTGWREPDELEKRVLLPFADE